VSASETLLLRWGARGVRLEDGQLHRQECLRAFRQSLLLGHSQPRQLRHSPLHGQDYKDASERVCQGIANDCKKL